jgi:hypothetical protein
MGHALRTSRLLHVEVSQARVFQFTLKISGGMAWMVYVTSSRRLHRGQVKDVRVDVMRCVGSCYH